MPGCLAGGVTAATVEEWVNSGICIFLRKWIVMAGIVVA